MLSEPEALCLIGIVDRAVTIRLDGAVNAVRIAGIVRISTRPVDFRNGLMGCARSRPVLRRDPFTGAVSAFRARRADRCIGMDRGWWSQGGRALMLRDEGGLKGLPDRGRGTPVRPRIMRRVWHVRRYGGVYGPMMLPRSESRHGRNRAGRGMTALNHAPPRGPMPVRPDIRAALRCWRVRAHQ